MADKPYIDEANYTEAEKYKKMSNVDIYIPVTGITLPKDSDYKRGYFYRHFYLYPLQPLHLQLFCILF